MPHLDDNALKVLKVLERHRTLDTLQIASLAEISVSAASEALNQLAAHDLLIAHDGGVYSPNEGALSKMLEVA